MKTARPTPDAHPQQPAPIAPPRRPRRAVWAAAVAATALAGCAARPGVGPDDARTPVDVGAAPWRSLGLVATEVGGRCTGAVIGPRAVLTAAHCVFNPRTASPVEPRLVHFLLAATPSGHAGHARAAAIIMGPGFRVAPGVRPDPAVPPDADWAVLVLDTAFGEPGRALPLAAGYARPGTPLAFGGYQADRAARQMVADLACAVTGYGRDAAGRVMMRHSCAATSGASGGPLLARGAGQAWVVAGIGSLAKGGVSGGWAVPTAAIARTVSASAPTAVMAAAP